MIFVNKYIKRRQRTVTLLGGCIEIGVVPGTFTQMQKR
jgi:hypothetical protein